jgi:hypothetical protein
MVDGRVVRRWLVLGLVGAAIVFALLQLVPYGWWHENPPVTSEAPWPDEASADLARRACYSCHSNETDWPVYSWVAPMSWLVRKDVESGRHELNFSEWDEHDSRADDAAETVTNGDMPPGRYTWLHPDAKLSEAEIARLASALTAMDDHGGGDSSGPGGGDD